MMRSDMDRAELEKQLNWYEKRYGPYIEKRGLGNWKNLFRKPTLYEWAILFMVVMALFMGWAYQVETEKCRQTLQNIDLICVEYQGSLNRQSSPLNISQPTNFTFTFKADDLLPDGEG